jgi:hypothetical protein
MRDVHQRIVHVKFACGQTLPLTRNDAGQFVCPLGQCPYASPKPANIQKHCRIRPYTSSPVVPKRNIPPKCKRLIGCLLPIAEETPSANTTIPPAEVLPEDAQYITFASLGLVYLKALSIYTCLICQVGMKTEDIAGHISNNHQATSSTWKNDLEEALRIYPGINPAKLAVSHCVITCSPYFLLLANVEFYPQLPSETIPAIKFLKVHQGFACEHCSYASGAKSTMVKHRGEKHQMAGGYHADDGFKESPVQTFSNFSRRYFAVQVSPEFERAAKVDPGQQELEFFHSIQRSRGDPTGQLNAMDVEKLTPWLRRTGWVEHLGDFPLVTLAESAQYNQIMSSEELGMDIVYQLHVVGKAFDRVWVKAVEANHAERLNSTLTLLRANKMGSYDHQDIAPFQVTQEASTLAKYNRYWKTYVLFLSRLGLEQQHQNMASHRIIAPHLINIQPYM